MSIRLKCTIVITSPSSVSRYLFTFSSYSLTKLDQKQELNYQVCVFRADKKKDRCPGLWVTETFSTSSLKRLNGIFQNITESKKSTSFIKLCFSGWSQKQYCCPGLWLAGTFSASATWTEFNKTWQEATSQRPLQSLYGPIRKPSWLPWPLICGDIFDFFPDTTELNATKLDRMQDLNVLYQFVFQVDRKIQDGRPASDCPRHFYLSAFFYFFSAIAEWNSTKLDRSQVRNIHHQVFIFGPIVISICFILKIGTQVYDCSHLGLFVLY